MLLFILSNQRSTQPYASLYTSEKIFLPDAVHILSSCSNVKTESLKRISEQSTYTQFWTETWNKKPLRDMDLSSLHTPSRPVHSFMRQIGQCFSSVVALEAWIVQRKHLPGLVLRSRLKWHKSTLLLNSGS